MRLLDTTSGEFVCVDDPRHISYAILSHVWTRDGQGLVSEQSFDDVRRILKRWKRIPRWLRVPPIRRRKDPCMDTPSPSATSRCDTDTGTTSPSRLSLPSALSEKVKRACGVARGHGFRLLWVDSCCIDKGSSSELSEAINSMFSWYQHARVCYAYLADVVGDEGGDWVYFRKSRWFRRGWTLQELVAPRVVIFLSQDWHVIGTKAALANVIEEVTGIDRAILTHEVALNSVSVARRISWAAKRQTTREEDEAYSLMGLLGVNMPTIYGEGRFAFIRLQEEVLRQNSDQTLFAWGPSLRNNIELMDDSPADPTGFGEEPEHHVWERPNMRNLLALSPRDFASAGGATTLSHRAYSKRLNLSPPLPEYTATCHGLRTTFPLLETRTDHSNELVYFALLACKDESGRILALILRPQELSKSQYFVGAFLCSTMEVEDAPRPAANVNGGIFLGEQYFRIIHLSQDFITTHGGSIRLRDIYVSHRPSRSRALAFPGYRVTYVALTQCSSPFRLILAEWCKLLLERDGFNISPLQQDSDIALDVVDPAAPHSIVLRRADHAILIKLEVCRCSGTSAARRLCMTVSTPSSSEHCPRSLTYPIPHPHAAQHRQDHPDHIFSWFFANGLASKGFFVRYPDGEQVSMQVTLSVQSMESSPMDIRTYALGVEVVGPPARGSEQSRQSTPRDCWTPPVTIVGSPGLPENSV